MAKERDAKEKQRHRSSSSRTDVIPKAEEERHDWKEGERIGEASNPGPRLFRNHAPERTTKREKAPAGQRGVRAVPQACAGELKKGINPGPTLGDDQSGNCPVGSDVGDHFFIRHEFFLDPPALGVRKANQKVS